jgi:hypothetical protein
MGEVVTARTVSLHRKYEGFSMPESLIGKGRDEKFMPTASVGKSLPASNDEALCGVVTARIVSLHSIYEGFFMSQMHFELLRCLLHRWVF